MSRRKSALPTSHDVLSAPAFRASKYFTRFVPVQGKPGTFRTVPQRAIDCGHCSEELRPAEFAGIRYRDCPNACTSTWNEAVNAHMSSLADDPGYDES